ncbi:nucleolin-like [Argonauta hians]
MSCEETTDDMYVGEGEEATNQCEEYTGEMAATDGTTEEAAENDHNDVGQNNEETPMEESADAEKADADKAKQEEEDENTLNLRRPYPNMFTISRLRLEDIKIAVSELSQFWDDTTCLTIRYIKEESGNRKGFMRMKFASEAEAEAVFNKLPKEINGKPFVRDPADEGNKEDYSLYVNNIPQGVTVEELQALFPSARNVVIPLNEEDQNQGYAIVECRSRQDAENIIAENKDLQIKENTLTFDLIFHAAKDGDKKSKYQNNQQKGRYANFSHRRKNQSKKGKRLQQVQQRKQRWSPERRPGRRGGPGQFMQGGRMDRGNRRHLIDGNSNWTQGSQNVTAALSQTSELLKGLTSLLGQQLLNPNQMGGQYGNQSWGHGMDQSNNYGYQSGGNRGYGNDNMNYDNKRRRQNRSSW